MVDRWQVACVDDCSVAPHTAFEENREDAIINWNTRRYMVKLANKKVTVKTKKIAKNKSTSICTSVCSEQHNVRCCLKKGHTGVHESVTDKDGWSVVWIPNRNERKRD